MPPRDLSNGDEFSFKNIKARLGADQNIEVWAKKFFVV
jgi:hypothetical protein